MGLDRLRYLCLENAKSITYFLPATYVSCHAGTTASKPNGPISRLRFHYKNELDDLTGHKGTAARQMAHGLRQPTGHISFGCVAEKWVVKTFFDKDGTKHLSGENYDRAGYGRRGVFLMEKEAILPTWA
jgi:hypothetical protein